MPPAPPSSPSDRLLLPAHPWVKGYNNGQITVVFPDRGEDDELRRFCDGLSDFWARARGPVTLLVDARQVRAASSAQRQMLIDFRKKNEALVSVKLAGAAFVIDSALVRGLFAAIFFVRPPSYPHRVFADLGQAQSWLAQKLSV